MALFKKKNKSCIAKNIIKFGKVAENVAVKIIADDNNKQLAFEVPFSNLDTIYLKYSKITNIDYLCETDIIEKQKSVAGRAVIGGIALGPLGAIVGGMSGIGTKSKKDVKFYLIINYKPNPNGSEKVLTFEDTKLMGVLPLCNHLKKKLNLKEKSEASITEL